VADFKAVRDVVAVGRLIHLVHRTTSALVHRTTSALVHRTTNALVHRTTSALVHRTTGAVVLGAVVFAAALGLSGCGKGHNETLPTVVPTSAPTSKPSFAAPAPPTGSTAPLPPPEALTDVMARLTDPNVPGADKLDLIQNATPDDAATLDTFTKALRDSGFMPLSFEARDVTWMQSQPGSVTANVVVKSANAQPGRDFTFPMDFVPAHGSWQLSRQTADMIMKLGQQSAATPTR
jgi:hypothetical protein